MNEELQFIIDTVKEQMDGTISHLENELVKMRAGRANPSILNDVRVDYYGVLSPINQVSNVNTLDGRTITVQPWEKGMLGPIQKSILAANLGFNPTNNGTMLIISVPPLTEERRKDLVKRVHSEGETARVSIRNARKEGNNEIRNLKKSGSTEDEIKETENKIQQLTDSYIVKADKYIEAKEKEIMTV